MTPIRRAAVKVVDIVREERSMRRAAASIPKPIPWDWARPRVLPLLAGPCIDQDGELVRSVADIGCALVYGLPLGRGFALVDRDVAGRWECTTSQIHDTAMANLRRKSGALPDGLARGGTLSGRIVRVIRGRPGWGASIVLVPDTLERLLGGHDQIIVTPGRGTLVSLPIETPDEVVADIAVDFELSEVYPLLLDPFALIDGQLTWSSYPGEDVDDR